ncbi:UNVERIFIED_CONTAM: hypothetical protein Sindi_2036300 [Sesamum indicum]
MSKKSMPLVMLREASTSKVKGKRAKRWKRKKGKTKAKAVISDKDAKSAPVPLVRRGTGKRKKGVGKKKLSKDELVLRLGDGKAVISDRVRLEFKDCYFVPR